MFIKSLNIFSVLGVQIALWLFYPWWIALLSLPSAILVAAVLAFILAPLTSIMANHPVLWEYHKAISPSVLFGVGQIVSAIVLSQVFL